MESEAHSRARILTALVLAMLVALAIVVTAVAASTGSDGKPGVSVTAGSSWTAASTNGSSWT